MRRRDGEFTDWQQAGRSRDEIPAALHGRGLTITAAIKASMQLFGIVLGDAKALVASHPSWAPTAEAAGPFHHELIRLFREVATVAPHP